MEVKGELILRVSAADKARLKVAMKVLDMDSAIQFKVVLNESPKIRLLIFRHIRMSIKICGSPSGRSPPKIQLNLFH